MIAGIDPKLHTSGVAHFVAETLKLVEERPESLKRWGLLGSPQRARIAMASASLALVSENTHSLSEAERVGLENLVRLAHIHARCAWEKPHLWSFLRLPGNAVRELKEFRESLLKTRDVAAGRAA